MFRVVSFFDSTKSIEYSDFLNQSFHIGMLGLINSEKLNNTEPLFYQWNGKKLSNWIEFTKDNIKIEFYKKNDPYKITNLNLEIRKQYYFPFPRNINEFICDCERCNVILHWSNYVIKTNDIKNIISIYNYKNYMNNLLEKIGKK